MKPLISIVVAVYNAEKYLEKCLDSLINQTYENTEIILVNDFSKDNSLDICKKYEQKYENIILLNNLENLGVSATRNNGIQKSTGEYICFVDSDDYVENVYLEKLFYYYKKYDTVPICGFIYHDEFNHEPPKTYSWSEGEELVSLGKAFKLNSELYLTALWNKLFDNRIIKKYNILFDESISIGEDLRFSIDYFNKSNKEFVYAFSDPLYHYTKLTDDSLMSNLLKSDFNSAFDRLKMIRDLGKKYNNNIDIEFKKASDNLSNYYIYFIIRHKSYSIKSKYNKIKSFYPSYSYYNLFLDLISCAKEKIYNRFIKR